MAQEVQYVAEGPCCSMCLSKMHVSHTPIKSVDEYHRKMKGIEMFPEDGVRCRINFYSTPEDEG